MPSKLGFGNSRKAAAVKMKYGSAMYYKNPVKKTKEEEEEEEEEDIAKKAKDTVIKDFIIAEAITKEKNKK